MSELPEEDATRPAMEALLGGNVNAALVGNWLVEAWSKLTGVMSLASAVEGLENHHAAEQLMHATIDNLPGFVELTEFSMHEQALTGANMIQDATRTLLKNMPLAVRVAVVGDLLAGAEASAADVPAAPIDGAPETRQLWDLVPELKRSSAQARGGGGPGDEVDSGRLHRRAPRRPLMDLQKPTEVAGPLFDIWSRISVSLIAGAQSGGLENREKAVERMHALIDEMPILTAENADRKLGLDENRELAVTAGHYLVEAHKLMVALLPFEAAMTAELDLLEERQPKEQTDEAQ
jgi:hypothetical protein